MRELLLKLVFDRVSQRRALERSIGTSVSVVNQRIDRTLPSISVEVLHIRHKHSPDNLERCAFA